MRREVSGRFTSATNMEPAPRGNGKKKRKAASKSKKVNDDNPYGLSDKLSKHELVYGPRRAAVAAARAVEAAAKAEMMETEIETETETKTAAVKVTAAARTKWTPHERQRLVEGIKRYGKDKKKQLASLMQPRTYGAVERYIRNNWIQLEAEVEAAVEAEAEVEAEVEAEGKEEAEAEAEGEADETEGVVESVIVESNESDRKQEPESTPSSTTNSHSTTTTVVAATTSPAQLLLELLHTIDSCTIDLELHSVEETLGALEEILQNPSLLEFFTYAGIVRLIDFLNTVLNDQYCKGAMCLKFIHKVAQIITKVCCSVGDNNNGTNKEIATKIIRAAIDHGAIHTLVQASNKYSGGKDALKLQALASVWSAVRTIFTITILEDTTMETNPINNDQAILVLDAGIDIITRLRPNDDNVAGAVLEDVFGTLINIVRSNYVTPNHFRDRQILSKCIDIFPKMTKKRRNRSHTITSEAVRFFNWCRVKKLFDEGLDYERILPFLTTIMKKFRSDPRILDNALGLIHEACDSIENKALIIVSGILEAIIPLLAASVGVNENQKNCIREIIDASIYP